MANAVCGLLRSVAGLFLAALACAGMAAGKPLASENVPDGFFVWNNSFAYPVADSPLNMRCARDIDAEGFVSVRDGHFYTRSGRINFFGLNVYFVDDFPSHAELDRLADHLARVGFNIVRLTVEGSGDYWADPAAAQHRDAIDGIDYFVAQLKRQGIYVQLPLHQAWSYPNTEHFPYRDWAAKAPAEFRTGHAVDNFVPELIALYKARVRALFCHRNPYTGLAYRDDPVVALTDLQNEHSLYKAVFVERGLDTLPEPLKAPLRALWADYIAARYAGKEPVGTAYRAGAAEEPIPRGVGLPVMSKFEQYSAAYRKDFLEFILDRQRRYYAEIAAFLREQLHVRIPATGTQITYLNPLAAADFDFIDSHCYWSPAGSVARDPATGISMGNRSMVPEDQGNLFLNMLAWHRIEGKPFVISEHNFSAPNEYDTEGGLLLPLYARLQDLDGVFYYSYIVSTRGGANAVRRYIRNNLINSSNKRSLFPLAEAVFRDQTLEPFAARRPLVYGSADVLDYVLEHQPLERGGPGLHYFSRLITSNPYRDLLPPTQAATARLSFQIVPGHSQQLAQASPPASAAVDRRFQWKTNPQDPKRAMLRLDDDFAKARIGWVTSGNEYRFRGLSLSNVQPTNGYFVFGIFNREGRIGDPGRHVVTLTSGRRLPGGLVDAETGEALPPGDHYGKTVRLARLPQDFDDFNDEYLEDVPGRLSLRLHAAALGNGATVYKLGADGAMQDVIPSTCADGVLKVELGKHRTIAYAIVVD